MVTKVHMEALSPTMEEGEIVRWLVDEGDTVEQGDVLAEIETDKATMELTARGSGVLRERLLEEGDTAPVGTVIGIVADEDEDIDEVLAETGDTGDTEDTEDTESTEEHGDTEEEDEAAKEETATEPEAAAADGGRRAADGGPEAEGRVKASPLAKKLAAEAELDIARVEGSGPGGRITKADVEQAVEEGVGEKAAGAPEPAAAGGPRFVEPSYEGPEVEEVAVSQMRKSIAKRLVQSLGPVPTFYLTRDVDMTRMMAVRGRMNERLEDQGLKVSVNDLIIKAVAIALRRHPEVNAQWHEDHIKRFHKVDIGVAVAVEDGLITPVIRGADQKGAAQIGAEVREMAGRAREKKLQPEEYTGATFSVSNLGMFGIDEFTAIINPPESGILAIGKVEDRVVVEDGEGVIMPRMKITMSCDHRVVDGATGARFLQTLTELLEEPALALA
ncbi:MAG: pyruvate dehydrogenase complex dihydrolipoamide acetyltransferase [Longimicrobiales bacterium]